MTEVKRLGRGLEALLGPITREQAAAGALRELPVAAIRPNPFQPRRDFDADGLAELAASIQASGLLQPVVVRSGPQGGYELIAGERRWRAVQQLGWQRIPAVVKDADDRALLTLALVENLQRDDLSPLDAASGYQRLMQEFALSQTDVARLVGRNRATIANTLRLLTLPAEVQDLVRRGTLTEGHARALLALGSAAEMSRIAAMVAAEGLSVREVEALVRGDGPAAAPARPLARRLRPAMRLVHAEQRRVEDALRRRLGTDVRVSGRRRGRGTIVISYYSNDDLARLLELILGTPYDG
jgi:ParB family chromosome partitioning protein